MNFHDVETLSAYLDGQLGQSEVALLEKRLASDANLRQTLDDLRVARGLLRQVPKHRVPRNFTLSPTMARIRAPEPRLIPVLRFASVLAAFLFLVTLAVNGLAPVAATQLAAAPAPAFGKGGGAGGSGGGCDSCAVATITAPQAFAAPAPTIVAGEAPQPPPSDQLAPTPEALAKSAPAPEANAPLRSAVPASPIPLLWVIILGVVGVLLGLLALALSRSTDQKWRSRWMRK